MVSRTGNTEISLPIRFVDELGRADGVSELRDVVSRWLPRVMGVDRGSVALLTVDRQGLEVHALGAQVAIPQHRVLPIDGTIVGQVYASRRAQIVDNLVDDERTDSEGLRNAGLSSCLAVPVVGGDVCYGTLNLAHTDTARFTDTDLTQLATIARLLGSYLRIHEQFESEQRLAATDELTGLGNRRAVLERAEHELARDRNPLALLFIDVDGFKTVNDAYGHVAGDAVLRTIAERLASAIRRGDIVGRLGGDEFLVLCRSADIGASRFVAQRLLDACSEPVMIGANRIVPRLSIGVTSTGHTRQLQELLIEADLAMTEAKRTSTEIVVVDERLKRQAEMVGVIDRDLEPAMRSGDMCFHYQPVRSLETSELVGCEALLRWKHPVHGWIPPPQLLERIEATGALNRFTRWMLETVAADLVRLRRRRPEFEGRSVAVNLQPSQLAWRSFVNAHMDVLARYDLAIDDITVEVVESGAIDVGAAAEDTLRDLAEVGVEIALDDFGTGYNALDYLGRFPIQTLKLDRSLVGAMPEDDTARAIVTGIVRIADELGIRSLAEGVEIDEEIILSRRLGIGLGQGYHLGRPVAIDDLRDVPLLLPSWPPESASPESSGLEQAVGSNQRPAGRI